MSDLPEEVAQALVVQGLGEVNYHYEPASFSFVEGDVEKSLYIIPIVELDGKLLVALPAEAWDRTVARRLVPRSTLGRAIKVVVVCSAVTDREVPLEQEDTQLWLGFLDKNFVSQLKIARIQEPIADVYRLQGETDVLLLPYARSLVEAADEQFAFVSAMSGSPGEEELPPVGGGSAVEARMERMEKMVFGLQKNMENFLALRQGDSQSLPAKSKSQRKAAGGLEADERSSRAGPAQIAGLDPSVVAAARKAGVGEAELLRLGSMVSKSHKLGDAPGTSRKPIMAADSEEEDEVESEEVPEEEEELVEDRQNSMGNHSMQKAVMKLTRIVDSLAAQKKPRGLDALLDGADAESQDPSSSSSGKSKAALYKKLRRSLLEDPKYVFQTIEHLMDEDFQLLRMAPGVPVLSLISTRVWMEYRSRLLHYPTTLRYVWAIAGIHDCLRQGRSDEARARCALMMAAADQTSLDGGNWLLSQEILLEEPPPFASFQGKKLPETWDQAASKLLDERWQDVLMWKVRSKDSYFESRKRLSQGKGGKGDHPKRDEADCPQPKKGAKGGKGQTKSESKKKGAEEEPSGQQN